MPDHRPGVPALALCRPDLDAIGAELAARLPLPDLRPPAMSTSTDLTDELPLRERIVVAIARMEERQKAIQDAADARHGQIVSMLATFVPRAEIEANQSAVKVRLDDLDKRVAGIEARTWRLIAWVLGTVGTAIAASMGVHFTRGG